MSRSSGDLRFATVILIATFAMSCRSSQPPLTTSDVYRRLVPELFPIDVRGTGVGYRHWIAIVPGGNLPEISFVIERSITPVPEQKLGLVTATYIEAEGKPLLMQLQELPRGLSLERIRSVVHVAQNRFTEETCPGITAILDTLEHESFHLAWRDAVWHPVQIDAIIKTSAASYSMTCYGSPCLGIGDTTMRAQLLLSGCAHKDQR